MENTPQPADSTARINPPDSTTEKITTNFRVAGHPPRMCGSSSRLSGGRIMSVSISKGYQQRWRLLCGLPVGLRKFKYRIRRYPMAREKPYSCLVAVRPTMSRPPLPGPAEQARRSYQIALSQKAALRYARNQLAPTPLSAYGVVAVSPHGLQRAGDRDHQFEPH